MDGNPADKLLALMGSLSICVPRVKQRNALNVSNAAALFIVAVGDGYSIFHAQVRLSGRSDYKQARVIVAMRTG